METQRYSPDSIQNISEGYLISLTQPGSPPFAVGDFLTIGRDPNCKAALKDFFVSTRHARIEKKGNQFSIRDLQSRNGTYLNGSRITEAVLKANDRLQFGESIFIFTEAVPNQNTAASKNEMWRLQLKRIPAFAATDFPVLITGPSGSGKEILSQSIHQASGRARGPYISINCSSLSENLIESELFGHVKGSFTGAVADRKGAFEAARGGTLVLDEVGDLPLSLQPKLLRALENKEIRPVGSDKSIETDVRIVAATHKNLNQAVLNGLFREDLFYRLNVCHVKTPALKERMEDFDDLLYSFAKQFRVRFSHTAIERLKKHAWPGNVRELKNLVARASAYFPGHHVQSEDIEQILENISAPSESDDTTHAAPPSSQISLIREIEREMIIRRLVANKGNQRRTAQELGLPKSTLHDRIRSYSIDLEKIVRPT